MLYRLKAKLSPEDYIRLSVEFAKKQAEEVVEREYYFSRYKSYKKAAKKGEPLVKVVETCDYGHFIFDNVSYSSEVEVHDISSTIVNDPNVIKKFLFSQGFSEYFFKKTTSFITKENLLVNEEKNQVLEIGCSLLKINNEYFYIVVDCDNTYPDVVAKDCLITILDSYGVKSKIDYRPWPEILGIN